MRATGRFRIGVVALASGVVALGAALAGQQAPLFRSRVDLVVVDANVVDGDGLPIEGLDALDFVVMVDGIPRKVAAVDYASFAARAGRRVETTPIGNGGAATVRFASRRMVFVVDESSIRSGDERHVTAAAGRFLDQLGRDDLAGAVTLPFRLAPFQLTRDRGLVKRVLDGVGGQAADLLGELNIGTSEAFAVERGDRFVLSQVIARECTERQDVPDCPARVELESDDIVRYARLHAQETVAGLIGVIDALRPVEGPKTVILVAGALVLDRELGDLAAVERSAVDARASLYVLQIPRSRSDTTRLRSPRSLLADEHLERDGLDALAGVAGGALIPVTGAASLALDRISRELSGQYLLSLEAGDRDRDGRPHSIEVMVNRPGANVRARRQFVVAPPERAASASGPSAAPSGPAARAPIIAPTFPREIEGLMSRVGDYVASYEARLSGLVAQEQYDQAALRKKANGVWEIDTRRRLVSDFLLVKSPALGTWTPFRDVVEVDGRKVGDREDRLRRLFLESPTTAFDAARQLTDESSRYNVGLVQRTVNVPTLALMLLTPANQWRAAFRKAGEELFDGRPVWRIEFNEQARPTFVRGRDGDIPLQGAVWVEPGTGLIRRTRLRASMAIGTLEITVTYQLNDRMGLLVPVQMDETYDAGDARVEGTARYSNFRRFQVLTDEAVKAPKKQDL